MTDQQEIQDLLAAEAPERTALYHIYGDANLLLYIGISNDFGRRWKQHAKVQPWWNENRRMTVEWYGSRPEAEEAEVAAIGNERPKYNIQHAAPITAVSEHGQCCRCNEPADEVPIEYYDDGWPRWPKDIWWRPLLRSIGHFEVLDGMVCPRMSATEAFGWCFTGRLAPEDSSRPIVWAQNDGYEEGGEERWSAHADITCASSWELFEPEHAAAQEQFLRALVAAGRCTTFKAGRSAAAFGFVDKVEAQFAGVQLSGLMWGSLKNAPKTTAILLRQAAEMNEEAA